MRRLVTSYLEDFVARGDAIAFADRKGLRTVRWSYKRIAESAYGFANHLAELGVERNDRVLLSGNNSGEWVIAFFACLLRGAIVVPLEVQNATGFVARVQQQVNAKVAVAETHLEIDLLVIPLDEVSKRASPSHSTPDVTSSPTDIAEIVFTSGTTAEPKGVVLTHQNLIANLEPLEQEIRRYLKWERLVHPVRFLNLLPLSHVFGQFMGIFIPQLLSGEVFFIDSLKPSQIAETVRRERISVIACVPRMLDTLRDRVEREISQAGKEQEFLESLRAADKWSVPRRWWKFRRIHRLFGWKFWAFISGGATLDSETEEFWQRLGFAVIQGYGMTETASLVSVNHPFKKRSGSIGRVMSGQQVTLSDDGEILVKGANVSSGYWKGNENLQGHNTASGWFHTGDLGELDANGNLYFKARKKDVIVTASGMNIYPEDIELVLNHQPEIKEATVVGIDGPRGPEPVAALILRASKLQPNANDRLNDPDINPMIERANASLQEHQKVRRWFIWPEPDFPRTSTQKIKKRLVAEWIQRATNERSSTVSGNALAELIARLGGDPDAAADPRAKIGTDLKLDSLGRVELLNALEDRYQVEMSETAFSEATTVSEISQLIQAEPTSTTSPADSFARKERSYPYPHWPHVWPIKWLRIAALYLIIFPFVIVMGRPRIRGAEHLRNEKGPLLFISNHVSMVDHALILWALPRRFRHRLSIAMDGELLREWLYPTERQGWFLRLRYFAQYLLVAFFFNVFAMPRHSGFRRSFAFAGEMMDAGYSVLVFPEGRRSPDGRMHSFRAGTGLLAKEVLVPIVPIRLDGLYELAQQQKHFAPAGSLAVNIGMPIQFPTDKTADEISKDLEELVRKI